MARLRGRQGFGVQQQKIGSYCSCFLCKTSVYKSKQALTLIKPPFPKPNSDPNSYKWCADFETWSAEECIERRGVLTSCSPNFLIKTNYFQHAKCKYSGSFVKYSPFENLSQISPETLGSRLADDKRSQPDLVPSNTDQCKIANKQCKQMNSPIME